MMAIDHRARFDKDIKANRVFVLGAGFSAAAGVPLTNELLQMAFTLFADECPGIYSRVEGYALESIAQEGDLDVSRLNFSDLCTFLEFVELREYGGGERWSENGSREKLALRFFLAKALAACTPNGDNIPQLYIDFALQLQPRDIIISFNWDGLLEAALSAVGKKYTYDRSDDHAIAIYKLHGSLNWRLGEPKRLDGNPPKLPWAKLDFGSGMMDRHLYCTMDLLNRKTWQRFPPLSEVDPYLVLPGYGKAFDVRANAPLWYKPEFNFAFTHDVYIIGLSLAHDDFFIKSFFLSNLPYIQSYSGVEGRKVFVINPSSAVYSDYEFVLSTGYAEVWNDPFSVEHVKAIVQRTAA
ncbi:MAG TPA: hypothetical protein PKE23_10155 [Anaerolineales bacterium]|nr:hypothetical protein [Anaerolineales bacterium]